MAEELPVYSTFFGMMGAASSIILCSFGSAYGTAKSGTAISTAATRDPGVVMKSLLPVVMAGIICIYGLVASVIITNDITASIEGYSTFKGYIHFGSGLSVGMAGLGSGWAIGQIGSSAVRATVQQPAFFLGMMLILIFAEVLGLYGLIISLILATKH